MKTIFALFQSYDEAKVAVAQLIDRRFDEGEMNIIFREPVAQTGSDANLRVTNKPALAEKAILQGIDRVVLDGRSVIMPDVGAVRMAGRMAAMTGGGMMPEKPLESLRDVLAGLGVPKELAAFYGSGVLAGGLLFWVRADEGRAAEATEVLSSRRAEKLANYA